MYKSALTGKSQDDLTYYLEEPYLSDTYDVLYHNICIEPYPLLFDRADVIYSELVWEAGFEKLRAESPFEGSYKDYLDGIIRVINDLQKPTFIVCSRKTSQYLTNNTWGDRQTFYNFIVPSSENTNIFITYCDSDLLDEFRSNRFFNSEILLKYLSSRFDRCLDFCCGYGEHLLKNFNNFIASDVNRHCLGYLVNKIKE